MALYLLLKKTFAVLVTMSKLWASRGTVKLISITAVMLG